MIFLIESGIILNRDIWEIGAAGAQLPYKQTVTGSNPVSPTINYMPRFCVAFLFWAFSSAGEHFLHTEGVIGSIPVTPTICFKVRLRRTFFVINVMTLRGILTVQLPLQARWTCEARLARAFRVMAQKVCKFPTISPRRASKTGLQVDAAQLPGGSESV